MFWPMPNRATLSVTDLYNSDETLFDGMVLPSDFDTAENRELLINSILMRSKDFEALYPDALYMKSQIPFWSGHMLYNWNKAFTLANLEYNPIENYDRYEESAEVGANNTDRENQSVTMRTGQSDQSTTDRRAEASQEKQTGLQENKKAGYNTANTETQTATDSSSDSNRAGTATEDRTAKGTETETGTGKSNENEKTNHTISRASRIHGNIGVTTAAQMITAELELAPVLNLIHRITEDFITEFCILVY